jgi:hypothetical protein
VAAASAAAGAAALAIGSGGNAQQRLAAVTADLRRLVTAGSNGSSAAGDTRVTPTPAAAAVSWAQVVALQLQLARCSSDTTEVRQVRHKPARSQRCTHHCKQLLTNSS